MESSSTSKSTGFVHPQRYVLGQVVSKSLEKLEDMHFIDFGSSEFKKVETGLSERVEEYSPENIKKILPIGHDLFPFDGEGVLPHATPLILASKGEGKSHIVLRGLRNYLSRNPEKAALYVQYQTNKRFEAIDPGLLRPEVEQFTPTLAARTPITEDNYEALFNRADIIVFDDMHYAVEDMRNGHNEFNPEFMKKLLRSTLDAHDEGKKTAIISEASFDQGLRNILGHDLIRDLAGQIIELTLRRESYTKEAIRSDKENLYLNRIGIPHLLNKLKSTPRGAIRFVNTLFPNERVSNNLNAVVDYSLIVMANTMDDLGLDDPYYTGAAARFKLLYDAKKRINEGENLVMYNYYPSRPDKLHLAFTKSEVPNPHGLDKKRIIDKVVDGATLWDRDLAIGRTQLKDLHGRLDNGLRHNEESDEELEPRIAAKENEIVENFRKRAYKHPGPYNKIFIEGKPAGAPSGLVEAISYSLDGMLRE